MNTIRLQKRMGAVLAIAGAAILLAGCAGLPEPEGTGNSLIIGSFVLEFPDGFFDRPACTIENGISLRFRNITTDKRFRIKTTYPGFFYFLASGSDDYMLETYAYETQKGTRGTYTLSERKVDLRITPGPDRVVYVGHIAKVYSSPTVHRAYGDRSTTWDFKESWAREWNKSAAVLFIADQNPESRWLRYEIVEYGRKK